jgi:DNA processing protein
MSHPESWIALSMVPEIGNISFRKLLSAFGSPEAVFDSSIENLTHVPGISERKAKNIKHFSAWANVEKQIELLHRENARVVTFDSPEYPAMLRQIEDAPAVLFVKGRIEDEDKFAIAIVGSRKTTSYGRLVAERLSSELAGAGFTIVSGMARGIDTVSHIGSMQSGGRTIAVLGSGIDRVYPPENRSLMERIAGSGYVVSEYPFGTGPNRENFPRRNRLISGLSLGVVVVEAAVGSGALITARSALEQNREVFAVPANINSPTSAGTNELIKSGAKLIQKSDDIIEELAPVLRGYLGAAKRLKGTRGETKSPRAAVEMTTEEKRLCDILTGEPVHIDVLSRELSLAPAKALTLLLDLELKGVVRQTEGKRFYLVC